MKPNARESSSIWAWVPVGLLGSMLTGLGLLAYIATDDPHFALEPSYYDKAVHWDRAQAEARASRASGIVARVAQPLVVAADGRTQLRLQLTERDGSPLRGGRVQVEAFPNAYAAHVEALELTEVEPGVFGAWITRSTPGLWELRVEVTHGERRFREVMRVDVTRPVKS